MSNRKKKICICHAKAPFMSGGAEILTTDLHSNLIKRGFDAEVISLPFKWYPAYEVINSALAWRLVDLEEVDGEKIDLVIGTKYPAYAVKHSNKVVWLFHQHRPAYDLKNETEYFGLCNGLTDNGEEVSEMVKNIDNRSFHETKGIYTISKNVSERLKEYNGFDSEYLYPPPRFENQLFCENYDDYILSVGRVAALKRLEILINSIQFCDKKIKVLIAGTGNCIEELKKLTANLNLEDRVTFLGYVSDEEVLRLYANAFAVFFAPKNEDYGYITIESFMSKKPVITCDDSGGILEFVEDSINGYVCPKDYKIIGERINKLYNNKGLCKQLGNSGYEKVRYISWDTVINKLTSTI
ncbi:MAG: glycosyltransferase family 4 protein [Oscillospiraceae bacterium]|nr:glycosyltransferase family 4 protein [Oscillospiraceae bacterium]